jgi:hypothetical protein
MGINCHGNTRTKRESMTADLSGFAPGAADPLDDWAIDSITRAQKALRLYREHLERTNDPMFSRNKKEPEPEPINWQAQTPAQDIKAHVPTMVEQLRKRREEKVRLANQLDEDIMALDHEITWLERHPGSEYVIKEFVRRHEEEIAEAKRQYLPKA